MVECPPDRPVQSQGYGEIFGIRDHQAAQRAVQSCSRCPRCLTPDQLEKVVGGLASTGLVRDVLGGATMGYAPLPQIDK